jgi:CubicO group peptidase (beta-lactamase class C family)
MKFKILVVLFLGTLIASTSVANDGVKIWIESNVPEMMREAKMPGLAIAVVQDGETIYAEGFGARDPAKGLPATPDTLFGIGSITKSFVAISILQLAEQGKLDLDDPVSKHIPFELGLPGKPITIRHFLSHSPGFPSLATSSILLGRGLGEDPGVPMSSAADFYRYVNGAKDEIVFDPGQHFFYNNAAWRMLGAIVQEVSGMPFHEYVTANVIRPLGMQRTTFNTDELFADPDHLIPHRHGDDGLEPTNFPYPNPNNVGDFSFLSAAGGISSSVNEMTRYVNMLINLGQYADGQLVPRRAMREMQTLHIRRPDGYFGVNGYGFGLGITPDFLGEKLVDHGGSILVSTARMAFIAEHGIGVIMMGNSGGMDYATIAESVLAILMDKNPDDVIPSLGVRKRMTRLEGAYAIYEDIESLDVVKEGGMLYLKQEDDLTPLIPEDADYRGTQYYLLYEGRKTPVEFRFGDDGSVSVLIARYVFRKK